ncbi:MULTISPECIES: hypothetical protein [Cyanophyceae]|uniref:hypothetical protein n=1 Tax=Cyanophyceae TaxID=3028117 RepID=UPI000B292A57|nr:MULTISPECIES: hypothetical protein [Cyanophyceae]
MPWALRNGDRLVTIHSVAKSPRKIDQYWVIKDNLGNSSGPSFVEGDYSFREKAFLNEYSNLGCQTII